MSFAAVVPQDIISSERQEKKTQFKTVKQNLLHKRVEGISKQKFLQNDFSVETALQMKYIKYLLQFSF